MRAEDLQGRRFGKLVVTERVENTRGGQARWSCRCDCGQRATVNADNLKRGRQVSCGCYQRAIAGTLTKTHGMSGSTEYAIWSGIIARCTAPLHRAYPNYGGRGITVCPQWRASFENFYADMGKRPRGATLDRIDNDGPYAPWNCRWSSWNTQANNRRSNRLVTYQGKTRTLAEWSEWTGIPRANLSYRVRKGWPLSDVFRNGTWDLSKPHVVAKHHRWAYSK